MTAAASVRAALRSEPLSNRNFRLLATGQFTSTVGDYCYAVALRWLVLSTHGGPVLLGTVLACYGVPRTVFIPLGGWLADKVGSRAIMLSRRPGPPRPSPSMQPRSRSRRRAWP